VRRFLIVLGIMLIIAGVLWPWLRKLGFGRLPGDIRYDKDGYSFYFPLTTGLIISVVISLVVWILRK
jgi:hypothetical protein